MLNHLLPQKQRVVEIDSIGFNSVEAVEQEGPIFAMHAARTFVLLGCFLSTQVAISFCTVLDARSYNAFNEVDAEDFVKTSMLALVKVTSTLPIAGSIGTKPKEATLADA